MVRKPDPATHTKALKVVYRTYSDGDVIAIMPELPGTRDSRTCMCYMRAGQHGTANPYSVFLATRPATEAEADDLEAELRRQGYAKITRAKRVSRAMHQARYARLAEWARTKPDNTVKGGI